MAGAMCVYPYFLLLLTLSSVCLVRGQSGTTSGAEKSGTTPGIKTTFIDRCNTFQKQNPVPFVNNPKNCSLLWELFLNSFAKKNSCSIDASNYKDFLSAANHTVAIKDQALFWAFVGPFVYNFTASQKGRYVTILDLLPGYTLHNLTWCWNSSQNDLDNKSCPSYKDCPFGNEAVRSFWKANSQMLARRATGKVFVMLNGSTDGAYTNRSLFYTVEVPSMHNPPITAMQVILVHNPGGPFREYCNNGTTLAALKKDMRSKSIEFECVQNLPDVTQRLCRMYPQYAKYCPTSGTPPRTVSSIVAYQVIAIIILWVVKFIL